MIHHIPSTLFRPAFRTFASLLLAACLMPGALGAQPEQAPPTDPNLLVIHYHRYDGNYDRAGIWSWDGREQKNPEIQDVLATGKTDYGVYFVVNLSLYGNDDGDKEKIGFIPRLRQDWNQKDGTDRFWNPTMGREVWLIGNDPAIYSERPATGPKIVSASIDRADLIFVKLSKSIAVSSITGKTFTVKETDGTPVGVSAARGVSPEGANTFFVQLSLAAPLDLTGRSYTVSGDDYSPQAAVLRKVLDDPERFTVNTQLGAIYSKDATTFRLFAPVAKSVDLLLFSSATQENPDVEIAMQAIPGGAWENVFHGDLNGRFYQYRVDTARHGKRIVNDPSATNTTGSDGHARITDLRATDPAGFRPIARPKFGGRPQDAVIYEIHVRDFTIQAESGVDEKTRGKYLGFIQPGTRLSGNPAVTTGIDHLKELGVTHVQILPFQDFDNNETNPQYSWGYMTSFFNSPEGVFATQYRDDSRIRETKQMIQALKAENIGVILDVVYNHTGTQATFDIVAPGYYLRMKDDGSFWNGSGTGNEFRSEAPMARKFIVDSLKFWVEEYGIDGFRFDLMGLVDLGTIQLLADDLRKIYPEILIYGEPWTGADSGLAKLTTKDIVRGSGVAAFNDHFRNAIKGPPDGNEPGYVVDGRDRSGVMLGIAGSIDDWAAEPTATVNYVTCHDNLTLWDKVTYSAPNVTEADHRAMQNLSMGILAVSQGILFFHGGEELARTKYGVHNSYNSPDNINQMEWPRKVQFADVFDYHKNIIAIRRSHPVFRLDSAAEIRRRLRFHEFDLPSDNAIIFTLDGRGIEGEAWKETVVLINPETKPLEFRLPLKGQFGVFANGQKVSTKAIGRASQTFTVEPRSLAILARTE